jgi:RNA polymerase sigma factor (sigma-70 family)
MLREPSSVTHNFSQFMECAASIGRYIRRRVRDRDEAAELFQEVSILLLSRPGAPPAGQRFDSWCRGVARNVVAHHFRRQRRQASLLHRAKPEGHTLLAQAPHDPESSFATRELLDRLFADIDERSRRLMLERYMLGRSAEEIAQQAEQSPTSVRMKLMRVRGAVLRVWPAADSWEDAAIPD